MLQVLKANQRGHANHGWLNSWHTFSFAHYYNPEQMGFSALRVINDDTVARGAGFTTHSHSDMEIISYVLDGALEHKDTLGTGSVIRPGDVQMMEAGHGISHSEFNHSHSEPVHFLQIWILPDRKGLTPSYQQRHFSSEEKRGKLRLVVSPDGREDSLRIHQDASLYAALVDGEEEIAWSQQNGRNGYLHVARGSVLLNGYPLEAGDGVKVFGGADLKLSDGAQAEVLWFDLPPSK
jgi:redox-sensitive bicupin YhaK (pirin superfamily)